MSGQAFSNGLMLAFQTIRSHKLRAFLTVLVAVVLIVVGIYAITTFNLTTACVGIGTLLAGVLFFRPRRYIVEGEMLAVTPE